MKRFHTKSNNLGKLGDLVIFIFLKNIFLSDNKKTQYKRSFKNVFLR